MDRHRPALTVTTATPARIVVAAAVTLTLLAALATGQGVASATSAPDRVGAVTLGDGEEALRSAVIDPDRMLAYFGTNTVPGRVVKVDLTTMQRVGAVTLASGEDRLVSAVIDADGTFGYFGTNTRPGKVVKVNLTTMQRVAAITLDADVDRFQAATIDPAGEYAYFGTEDASPERVVKIDLDSFAVADTASFPTVTGFLSAVIDADGEYAYFGTADGPAGRAIRLDLSSFEDGSVSWTSIPLPTGDNALTSAVIAPDGDFAYFGTDTQPGRVAAIDLDTLEHTSTVILDSGEDHLRAAVIAPDGTRAYFAGEASSSDPATGRLVAIDLTSMQRVGAASFLATETSPRSAVIAPDGLHAYVGTNDAPGHVVQVSLTTSTTPPPTVAITGPEDGATHALGTEVLVTATFTSESGTPSCEVHWGLGGPDDPGVSVGTIDQDVCSATFTYPAEGEFVIAVTISDDAGSATDTITVVVESSDDPGEPASAHLRVSPGRPRAGLPALVRVELRDDTGAPVAGADVRLRVTDSQGSTTVYGTDDLEDGSYRRHVRVASAGDATVEVVVETVVLAVTVVEIRPPPGPPQQP